MTKQLLEACYPWESEYGGQSLRMMTTDLDDYIDLVSQLVGLEREGPEPRPRGNHENRRSAAQRTADRVPLSNDAIPDVPLMPQRASLAHPSSPLVGSMEGKPVAHGSQPKGHPHPLSAADGPSQPLGLSLARGYPLQVTKFYPGSALLRERSEYCHQSHKGLG